MAHFCFFVLFCFKESNGYNAMLNILKYCSVAKAKVQSNKKKKKKESRFPFASDEEYIMIYT